MFSPASATPLLGFWPWTIGSISVVSLFEFFWCLTFFFANKKRLRLRRCRNRSQRVTISWRIGEVSEYSRWASIDTSQWQKVSSPYGRELDANSVNRWPSHPRLHVYRGTGNKTEITRRSSAAHLGQSKYALVSRRSFKLSSLHRLHRSKSAKLTNGRATNTINKYRATMTSTNSRETKTTSESVGMSTTLSATADERLLRMSRASTFSLARPTRPLAIINRNGSRVFVISNQCNLRNEPDVIIVMHNRFANYIVRDNVRV